jgi:CRISPR/Cas system endoribonuclease Cas6 (RAMP superfamily)
VVLLAMRRLNEVLFVGEEMSTGTFCFFEKVHPVTRSFRTGESQPLVFHRSATKNKVPLRNRPL